MGERGYVLGERWGGGVPAAGEAAGITPEESEEGLGSVGYV